MVSVIFIIVFVRWIAVSSRHSVVCWLNIQGSWFLVSRDILQVMISISFLSWCGFCGMFKGCLAEPSVVTVVLGLMHIAVVVQVIGGESHLPGNGYAEHYWVGHLLCIVLGSMKWCWWDPVGCQVSTWSVYQQLFLTGPLWGLSSWHQCKGIKLKVQELLFMYIVWWCKMYGFPR